MPLTNDPEELHLLAGVVAAPKDDAPRLIIADWYDEHGLHKRAHFIRECINHNLVELDSVQIYGTEWAQDIKPEWYGAWRHLHYGSADGLSVVWHRGFIKRAYCRFSVWEMYAREVEEHPIEEVFISMAGRFRSATNASDTVMM